jgi:hypothetical protein
MSDTAQSFAIPNKETRTEASVNWSKAFCPVCQPIVDRHFRPREAYLLGHAERLAEALKAWQDWSEGKRAWPKIETNVALAQWEGRGK